MPNTSLYERLAEKAAQQESRQEQFQMLDTLCKRQYFEYQGAKIPKNEKKRLQILRQVGILDTEPEELFDCMVRTIRIVFQCDSSAVAFIDEFRVWCKARMECRQDISRFVTPCDHIASSSEPLVVCDFTKDEKFKNHPFAKQVGLFYAGVPIVFNEHVVGMYVLVVVIVC